jgi:uncharacterized RDD family membrane protein YckC
MSMTPTCVPASLRVLGFVLDKCFISMCNLFGSYMGGFIAASLMRAQNAPEAALENATLTGMVLGWFFWGAVAWVINYAVLQGLYGSSLGKMICGTRVMREDGENLGVMGSIARSLAYWLSALPLYLGFAAALWDARSRCWHDRVCKTIVVPRNARYAGDGRRPLLLEDGLARTEHSSYDQAA